MKLIHFVEEIYFQEISPVMKNIINIRYMPVPAAVINRKENSLELNDKMRKLCSSEKECREMTEAIKNITGEIFEDAGCKIMKIKDVEFLASKYSLMDSDEIVLLFQNTCDMESEIRKIKLFRDREEEFNNIIGSIHDDLIMIDKDGIITNVLQNFESNYGISGEEAVGKSIFEMEERGIFNPSVAVRVLKSEKNGNHAAVYGCREVPHVYGYSN